MIIKSPSVTIDWGTGAEDFSDHVIAAMPDMPLSAVDDRTFGSPFATDSVMGAQSMTLACRYSDALIALLEGHEDAEGDMVVTPKSGGNTWTATVKMHKIPLPEIRIGEQSELEIVFAVTDEIDHV